MVTLIWRFSTVKAMVSTSKNIVNPHQPVRSNLPVPQVGFPWQHSNVTTTGAKSDPAPILYRRITPRTRCGTNVSAEVAWQSGAELGKVVGQGGGGHGGKYEGNAGSQPVSTDMLGNSAPFPRSTGSDAR